MLRGGPFHGFAGARAAPSAAASIPAAATAATGFGWWCPHSSLTDENSDLWWARGLATRLKDHCDAASSWSYFWYENGDLPTRRHLSRRGATGEADAEIPQPALRRSPGRIPGATCPGRGDRGHEPGRRTARRTPARSVAGGGGAPDVRARRVVEVRQGEGPAQRLGGQRLADHHPRSDLSD
ncbi:MAG: hypothetical protein MZU95_05495 [Desulfomicrobium escambiense]|nr:hypothetical protein [Desulfomicrobium escambiense]